MQGETPAILKRLIDGVSEKELKRSPGREMVGRGDPGATWPESEIVTVWRYRQMIENSGGATIAYDQESGRAWESMPRAIRKTRCDYSTAWRQGEPGDVRAPYSRRVARIRRPRRARQDDGGKRWPRHIGRPR